MLSKQIPFYFHECDSEFLNKNPIEQNIHSRCATYEGFRKIPTLPMAEKRVKGFLQKLVISIFIVMGWGAEGKTMHF